MKYNRIALYYAATFLSSLSFLIITQSADNPLLSATPCACRCTAGKTSPTRALFHEATLESTARVSCQLNAKFSRVYSVRPLFSELSMIGHLLLSCTVILVNYCIKLIKCES